MRALKITGYGLALAYFFFVVLFSYPLAAQAVSLESGLAAVTGIIPCGTSYTNTACQPCHFVVLMIRLMNFVMTYLAGPVALLLLMISGIYFTLGWSPKMIQKGKSLLRNTLIGLLIIFGAYFAVDLGIKIAAGNINATNFLGVAGPWNAPELPKSWGKCEINQGSLERGGGSVEESTRKVNTAIENAAKLVGFVLMGLSPLMILFAAWTYLTSEGDSEKLKTANNIIVFALAGIVVALLAFAVPTLISKLFGP